MRWITEGMVFLGSALMVYNICGFIRFARFVKGMQGWKQDDRILHIPIVLLVMFLLGYIAVGLLGKPDLIVAGILFGGSIFVFVMYHLLSRVTRQIVEGERLQAELLASESSSRAKSSFLANISHEMRTPMNVILGLDDMALKNPELSPQTRDQLEKIGLSGRHLLGLINNMLEMHELETGVFRLKREAFSLEEVLAQVDLIAQSQCETKGLEYQKDFKPGIPVACMGDGMALKQVLLNLLDNAVKYTDAPGTVRFSMAHEREAGDGIRLRFQVADTGVGIDDEFLPKLFQLFSREDDSTTNRHSGSGLSLSIVKGILDLMGGSISVDTKKHEGTVFTVIVSLEVRAPAAPAAVQAPEPEETGAEAGVSLAGRRVLIAEDLPENAEIVMDLLELEDIIPEHAENGQLALELFRRSPEGYYDAILMDLRMPVMDGLQATRAIRALDRADAKTVPILALTANAYESDVRQSLEAGMNMHLAKPADADALYSALKKCMGANQTRQGEKAL